MNPQSVPDLDYLQQALDHERHVHNYLYPSQASDCHGRPPLTTHPELLTPRRAYQPDRELELFDLQRVYRLLAQLTFERKLDGKARVSLGRQLYSLGAKLVRERKLKTVKTRFDPDTAEWVFLTPDEKEEIVRRPPKGLDVQTLTGLDPSDSLPAAAMQLSLPFFDLRQGVQLLLDS